MQNIILMFIFFSLSPLISFSQISLTVEIKQLRNNNGKLLLELNNENEDVIKGFSEEIDDNKCFIIMNLKPGKYAFKYFHDENNDGKLNTNFMGIPKEGYGFSNNAKGTFGLPSFEEMLFKLIRSDTIQCTPSYILKQK